MIDGMGWDGMGRGCRDGERVVLCCVDRAVEGMRERMRGVVGEPLGK